MLQQPRLFIGSSKESRNVANAIQEQLDDAAEVTVWDQNLYEPTKGNLENLVSIVRNFDFAIFVISPDDVVNIRHKTWSAARDNVIFESGLFIGRLGRERVFLVVAKGVPDLHLPSDWDGTTSLKYNPHRTDGNLRSPLRRPALRLN